MGIRLRTAATVTSTVVMRPRRLHASPWISQKLERQKWGQAGFPEGTKSYAVSIGRRPRERGVDLNLSLADDLIGCGVLCVNRGV